MNAPRLGNLRKEHLAGVRDLFVCCWQLLSQLPSEEQGVGKLGLLGDIGTSGFCQKSPRLVKAFQLIQLSPDPSRWIGHRTVLLKTDQLFQKRAFLIFI